jgi:hypothetical protein
MKVKKLFKDLNEVSINMNRDHKLNGIEVLVLFKYEYCQYLYKIDDLINPNNKYMYKKNKRNRALTYVTVINFRRRKEILGQL